MPNARPLRLFAFLFVLTFSSALASQTQADEFDRPGAYIGVNGVYAISLFQDEINDLANISDQFDLGDSPGVNARLGYRPVNEEETAAAAAAEAETCKRYEEELDINEFPQTARWKVTSRVSAAGIHYSAVVVFNNIHWCYLITCHFT